MSGIRPIFVCACRGLLTPCALVTGVQACALPLYHHHGAGLAGGLAGDRVVVGIASLVEQRGLRQVEGFRRGVRVEGPAAEGDDAATAVADREHHPVAEAVIAGAADRKSTRLNSSH